MTITPLPSTQTGCGSKAASWLTLPVAPNAAARSRFCGKEKLPQAIPLHGALTWLDDLKEREICIAGLDLDGPGDPLASLPMTLEIVNLLREKHSELALGITTLGLGLAEHAHQLAQHGVSRVTLLVDAVNPETVQNLYTWIRPGKRNIPLAKAAAILVEEQAKGITACRNAGLTVVVKTTVYDQKNKEEVAKIAYLAADLGAESMTLLPGKGWLGDEDKLPQPTFETMQHLSQKAADHIMVVELAAETNVCNTPPLSATASLALPKPTARRSNVAVLSSNGMDIDLHLGQAIKALIYGPREDGLACLLEARDLPEPGNGDNRWQQVAEILDDCFVLLASSAGKKPREILGRQGLPLLLIDDNVEGTVDVLYGGGKKKKCKN